MEGPEYAHTINHAPWRAGKTIIIRHGYGDGDNPRFLGAGRTGCRAFGFLDRYFDHVMWGR